MHNYEFIFFVIQNHIQVILTIGGEIIRFILTIKLARIILLFRKLKRYNYCLGRKNVIYSRTKDIIYSSTLILKIEVAIAKQKSISSTPVAYNKTA